MDKDRFILDGYAYSWRRLSDLRRQQLAERSANRGRQLALFELKDDCRPAAERTAADRFREPSLLLLMQTSLSIRPR